MGQHTPLYDAHIAAGARMVDFGGWDMPINYGSQIEEHHQVRRDAGMFDVSHMTVVEIRGDGARDYLRQLLANDVDKLKTAGRALYSCMLNEDGGVVDDLITYYLKDTDYRVVANAATREKDIAWMQRVAAKYSVELEVRDDLAMVAVQGPHARSKVIALLEGEDASTVEGLKPFSAAAAGEWFVARTGYTGEDGFEVLVPAAEASLFWNQLLEQGVRPCGLGARDTLRLEAGMNLYGQDMDDKTSPLEAGLGWTLAMAEGRDFIGRAALERQKAAGVAMKFVGLVLEDRGVLRAGQTVIAPDGGEGITTSGSFSPTLELAIALARVPVSVGERCQVDIRGRQLACRVVRPPFVRNGQACDGILG